MATGGMPAACDHRWVDMEPLGMAAGTRSCSRCGERRAPMTVGELISSPRGRRYIREGLSMPPPGPQGTAPREEACRAGLDALGEMGEVSVRCERPAGHVGSHHATVGAAHVSWDAWR